ncbi:2-oxo acid dehydrogenase subunit E2 [Sporolactobacillus shoreicorticis]|uniref:Dihydrolipoamide acetyltransferase component of pyruvate dehydrogenase complex n=1 Tax=Sporolactobacillus shoreicorticis TaxID=1923877 RepID=A0ABW5S0C3_9BACL|nr:dihydrolipoamide acetyltransferase family protein [Sporolactobacillus shoreicorticis]MCO7126781.1 2-oxo acid dehydrogenase subunit E2 [Sporolactobacillus shoreicorticis]
MAVEIIMPKMGMGMEEGTVVEWLKQKGDSVKKGESVVSISSDKIEKELEAPEEGVLIDIEADVDDVVPIGQPLGYIGAPGEAVSSPAASAPAPEKKQEDQVVEVPEVASDPEPLKGEEPRLRVSPAARRLAKIKNVDLATVTGTGPMGRITKADVAAAQVKKAQQPAEAAKSAPTPVPVSSLSNGTAKKVTGMRKVISDRMFNSLQTTAQLTLQTTVDVTELIAFQKKAREAYQINDEVRLTITDFIAKAAINALLEHKAMNSIYEGDTITTFDTVHLGVAVALDEGLVVPVIKDADKKSLSAVSREIRKASKQARGSELNKLQLSGSTFTITSLGTYGVGFFTPVINPPEVGILGVGTISEQPVYVGDELKKRSLMPLSLTFDHRAVDGAPAAAFLATVKQNLEAPFKLVL